MKTKKSLFSWLLTVSLALTTASCITDDSLDSIYDLPLLSISGADAEEMPVYNFYLGSTCVISPDISYSADKENLKYSWSVGSYANDTKGELTEVSTERDLNYKFTDGGAYYAHLTVTDGKVGQVMEYRININRTFEEGYLLTSTDAGGSGNLVFVKTMTPEEIAGGNEQVIIEHCLERMNEGYSEDSLVKALVASVTWPTDLSRVLVSTRHNCYVIDPNNFTIITDMKYADLYPGFEATEFMEDSYTPYACDKNKRVAHINLTYMFPYEYQYFKGFDAEDMMLGYYTYWGSVYKTTLYLNYTQNKVSVFNAYAPYYGYSSYFPGTGDLLVGKKLLSAIVSFDYGNFYILSQSESGDKVYFYTTDDQNLDPESFTMQEMEVTVNTALPAQGVRFVGSPKSQRYFYAIANSVYVLLSSSTASFSLPNKDQYGIRFDKYEEVTFMDVNIGKNTDELYVATYDKSTQRGNFYIYDCEDVRTNNGSGVKPIASYKDCAGKISYIIYKPRI